jgi:hypothetical protein
MKKLAAFSILFCVISSSYAQDVINTKDNKKLDVKVIEQSNKSVKYLMPDYQDGPVMSIKTRNISSIEYKNGHIDLVGNQNPRRKYPIGVSGGVALDFNSEFGYLLISTDYFIIPQIDIELNIGTDAEEGYYYSTGAKFHLNSDYSDKRFTPFAGVLVGIWYSDKIIQFPIGINYITKFGLNSSISLSKVFTSDSWETLLFEFKIGWRFK